VVQAAAGWLLEAVLLPRGEDNNIAPRFVDRSTRLTGGRPNAALDWVLGTAFHFGYGASWGRIYGLARPATRLPSLLLVGLLWSAIYLTAFSRPGVGTRTGTEQPPERRPWQKQASLLAVSGTFAATVGWLVARLTPSTPER
jgi:hypothetical protein